ncbi:MAG: Gfo/Idh/MocA family oxidoreductase [Verrucomicrobia bacterium]|nr:Gfo/Idh/MocA family oxidoreductase [Verrucomicrobiota bacterium]
MLKVAILGAGAISDSHLEAYLAFPDRCRVVALADVFPEKAAEKAARHGLEAAVFKGCADLIAGAEFDLASVCLPPFGHADATIELLRAGKHVLVEKPMATCLEECDAMVAAAREGGRVLSVVAQNRFKTPMHKLKQVLASGLMGKVLHAQVDSLWWRGSHYYDLWWRGTWEKEGGGCTINHAVHHLDLFQWMMGLPSELRAFLANLSHDNSEVEDFSTAILFYAGGSVAQITASLVHHGEEQQLVFQGEWAKVAVPWHVKAGKQRPNGFPEDDPARVAEVQGFYDRLPPLAHEGHRGQIANVLAAIAGEEPLWIDGLEGRKTLELITAIYQSAHLDQAVRLPLTGTAPCYTRAGLLRHARHFHEKTRNVDNFADNVITLGRNYEK